jgi:DNA-binding transcriptional MerR regulator
MPLRRTYQIKDVAELSGLTVRALHHYDEIGLLTPSARSAAGYRLYNDDDLLRLQQIIIGRELGLSLEAIRQSLDDPKFDRRQALREQRAELERRAKSTAEMIGAIDAAIEALDERDAEVPQMDKEAIDFKKIFQGFDPDKYADETKQRWGNTEAYKVSARRTKSYKEADWKKLRDGSLKPDQYMLRRVQKV